MTTPVTSSMTTPGIPAPIAIYEVVVLEDVVKGQMPLSRSLSAPSCASKRMLFPSFCAASRYLPVSQMKGFMGSQ